MPGSDRTAVTNVDGVDGQGPLRCIDQLMLATVGRLPSEADLFVGLALPGKQRGIWLAGQDVEPARGAWPNREGAADSATRQLAGREGEVSFVRVHADGTWAVFEW